MADLRSMLIPYPHHAIFGQAADALESLIAARDRAEQERDTAEGFREVWELAYKQACALADEMNRQLTARAEAAEAQRDRLQGWIRDNGQHGVNCMGQFNAHLDGVSTDVCSCGLAAALTGEKESV